MDKVSDTHNFENVHRRFGEERRKLERRAIESFILLCMTMDSDDAIVSKTLELFFCLSGGFLVVTKKDRL